jgi:hypothetical protein
MEMDKGRHRTRGGVKEQDLNQIEEHTHALEQEKAKGQGIVKDRDRDRDRNRNGNGNRDKDTNKDNARTLIEYHKCYWCFTSRGTE